MNYRMQTNFKKDCVPWWKVSINNNNTPTKDVDYRECISLVDSEVDFAIESKTMTLNGGSDFTFPPAEFRTTRTLYLFALNDGNLSPAGPNFKATMRLWGFRLWDVVDGSRVLVRDMVPCTDSNGVAGLYDLAATSGAKKFYASETSTPFEAGPVCPSARGSGFAVLIR